MKTKTLAIGLALPALAPAGSDPGDGKPKVGPAFGLTFATQTSFGGGYYNLSQAALIRPAVGMSIRVPVTGPWHFVPEMYYTQFGQRLGSFSLSYHQLTFPMLARAEWEKVDPITPFMMVGGQGSFRLGTSSSSSFSAYGGYFGNYLAGYGLNAIPIDAGVVAGFGIEFPVRNVEVHFDFRFYHGMVPHTGLSGLAFHRQAGVFGGLYF